MLAFTSLVSRSYEVVPCVAKFEEDPRCQSGDWVLHVKEDVNYVRRALCIISNV
jgi:hypothetical protein